MIHLTWPNLIGSIDRYEELQSQYVPARNVDVWLPDGYGEDPDQRYAVLYMTDGQNLFDASLSKTSHVAWRIDQTLSKLMQEEKVRKTIVVGVWSNKWRRSEYMPNKMAAGLRQMLFRWRVKRVTQKLPQSDEYLKYLINELKPMIDRNYSTLPDRENTFVMGSSMGGLMSLYALCEYPEIFKGAGCVSTHFPAGKGIMLGYMRSHLPTAGQHRVYFDYGSIDLDSEYAFYQEQVDQIMHEKGYKEGEDWLTLRFEGEGHSEIYWQKRVHQPLEFLLR
jgi:predicted alpha/beta superfamily hydrolase